MKWLPPKLPLVYMSVVENLEFRQEQICIDLLGEKIRCEWIYTNADKGKHQTEQPQLEYTAILTSLCYCMA